jgi:hypothetical protein
MAVPTVITARSASSEGVSSVRVMPSASLPCVASASCLDTPSVPRVSSRCASAPPPSTSAVVPPLAAAPSVVINRTPVMAIQLPSSMNWG